MDKSLGEFCDLFTEESGHVINLIRQEPGGWLCELEAGRVLVTDEEVMDFPDATDATDAQRRLIIENVFARVKR